MDGNNNSNSNSNLFEELIKKQRKNCKESKKLTLQDIRRITKNLRTSIFDDNCCSLWEGYITNKNKQTKSSYINFYFRHRKVALHRLLYENYVSDIEENQYIKYNCSNKGVCCNINHMYTIESEEPKVEQKDKNKSKDKKAKAKSKKSKKLKSKKETDKNDKPKKKERKKLVVDFD